MLRRLPFVPFATVLCLTLNVLLFTPSPARGGTKSELAGTQAAPAYGLSSLPASRPISIGYLNALRSETGGEVSYSPAQLVTEMDGLDWAGFDAVVHAFAEPKADGTIGEGLGNFS